MKKTILSLMLSASILTASPLFAMEDPNEPSEPPHKTAVKQTPPIDGDKKAKAIEAFQKHQRTYDNYNRICRRLHRTSGGTAFAFEISPHCDHLYQLMDQAYKNMKKYSE